MNAIAKIQVPLDITLKSQLGAFCILMSFDANHLGWHVALFNENVSNKELLMNTQKSDKGPTSIHAYEVQSALTEPIVEFISETFNSRTTAIDTAVGISKLTKSVTWVRNVDTNFFWTVLPDGTVQAVGVLSDDRVSPNDAQFPF